MELRFGALCLPVSYSNINVLSDVNKDLTLKAKDKDQTLKAKDQTPKDKDKDQTFKAKDQDKDLVNYNQYRVKLEKILKNNAKMGLNV